MKYIPVKMKYIVVSAAALVLTAVSLSAQEPDIRRTRWGMSPEDVISSESATPIYRDSEHLYYGFSFAGLDAFCTYTFGAAGLVQASFSFTVEHPVAELNRYLDDYKTVERDLRRRFGEPRHENMVWKDPRLRDQPSEHGFAVSIGHLTFDSLYETERSWVVHVLQGEQHSIGHALLFQAR